MRRLLFLVVLGMGTLPTVIAQTYKGSIAGDVLDLSTQERLPSVHVIVLELPGTGTATGPDGSFTIANLPVGTYSLKVSAVGYEPQILTNIVVSTGRQTPVHVRLHEAVIQAEGVTVSADYFSRAQQLAPVSSAVLDRSEVRRSPGGIQDVQRVVQSLPGVASSTDNINELIVRGGAPFENLTVLDGMEVPSINHYSNEFNSAGPINMLNADMIQDVQFSAGGFPVQYGDKSSSVMNITVREGNRNVPFSSSTGFNMAGYGTLLEGAFAGGSGSYILSARQSLLQLIDRVVGLSSLSLTAVPRYWDTHAKLAYDLSPSQRLKFNFLYGESRISVEGDPGEEDELRRNVTDSSVVERAYPFNKQLVAGLNWQSVWGKGYSVLTLYGVNSTYDVDVFSDFTRFVRGPAGEVLEHRLLNSRPVFINKSEEAFVAARYEVVSQVHPSHELTAGLQVQTVRTWRNHVWMEGDTTRFDFDRDGVFETGPVIVPQAMIDQELAFGSASKYFLYAGDKISLTPNLSLGLGVRYDHFTYAGTGMASARGNISYALAPATTFLTLAAGRYPQSHPLPLYGDRRNIGYNRNLRHMWADHLVLGLQHVLEDGLRMSAEVYVKNYSNVAVSEDFVYSAVDTFWSDRILTTGRRRSFGAELFLEKKQTSDLFGTLSISLSRTRDDDPRIPARAGTYPSSYDYTLVVTALGGHVVRGVRDALDNAPFFIKYPAYLLPLSNEIEISFKYRYQTGRPYTPREYVTWRQSREGGMTWSKGSWIDSDRINSARYPDYSRLDLQWISRFYLESWNINVYVAFQNVLNTKNVFFESYRSDGTVETVYQFAFFPVAGVEVEF